MGNRGLSLVFSSPDMFRDQISKPYFTVVRWFITDDLASVDDTPESMRVIADTIEHLKGHPILVADVLYFDTFSE